MSYKLYSSGKKNIVNIVMDSKYELCAILLPFTTSQRGINNYVKENWEAMEEQMQANLTQNPYIKRLHQNTEIAMEIHS